MKTQHKFFVVIVLFMHLNASFAQTNTATPAAKEVDEFAKKREEIKLTGIIPTDSASVADLMKRATAWAKLEAPTYKKSNATSTSSKLECIASFPVKPKELNPQVDYTGKVTMKVVIECKDSRYRYTVNEIKHTSKSGNSSGGSVDLDVPECGSMGMTDIVWKKLRGEMLTGAAKVVDDLKIAMSLIPSDAPLEEW